MKKVEVYYATYCPYSIKALKMLDEKGIKYKSYAIDDDEDKLRKKIGEYYKIEGDVTVEGVVGVTSNAYLSYDSEEDSLSFNFTSKPDGDRGSYSNPISIENWNKMMTQVEQNTKSINNLEIKILELNMKELHLI